MRRALLLLALASGPAAAQSMPGMAMPDHPASSQGGETVPPPLPPPDRYADRDYPPAAIARARARMMAEEGGRRFGQLLVNLAEVQTGEGGADFRWDGEGWYGGDRDRLVLKSEGEGDAGRLATGEVQALFSRAVGPYADLQAGARLDVAPVARSYATVAIEARAPYQFQVSAALFLSDRGDWLGRLEAWHDARITQRLVLQPRVELNLAAQDVPRSRVATGLSDAELGLRLRYEVARAFAPYVGVSWDRRVGAARLDRTGNRPQAVAGLRFWF